MKMTAEEIVEMYNKDRTRETMQKIAELNGCTIKEVGEFLKNAATVKKKPGRPKGAKNQKKTSAEEVLKDENQEQSSNESQILGRKRTRSYLIPDCVVEVTKQKIDEYKRLAQFHESKAEEYYLIVNEYEDFLNGGTFNGSENGI